MIPDWLLFMKLDGFYDMSSGQLAIKRIKQLKKQLKNAKNNPKIRRFGSKRVQLQTKNQEDYN